MSSNLLPNGIIRPTIMGWFRIAPKRHRPKTTNFIGRTGINDELERKAFLKANYLFSPLAYGAKWAYYLLNIYTFNTFCGALQFQGYA